MPGDRFYSSPAWRRLRALVLRERPVCQVAGCGRASSHVDHRTAIAAGGARLDRANLMALCHSCHSRKTAAVDRGYGNASRPAPLRAPGCTPDGVPRDPRHPWNTRR